MDKFIAYHLIFSCEAITPILFTRNKGSMLRGAFFGALRRDFCLNKSVASCLACPTSEVCPICRLVATVDRENARGAEVPRPFALEPVLSETLRYETGDSFQFGITLFGKALSLFPYVIIALQHMGEMGMGRRIQDSRLSTPDSGLLTPDSRLMTAKPGRFNLKEARVANPLTNAEKSIYSQGNRLVTVPDLPVTGQEVLDYSSKLSNKRLRLSLLTPLRLVINGKLVQELTFQAFAQRLLRRLTDLYHHCCGEELRLDFAGLLEQAKEVRIAENRTRWLDLHSYSGRQQRSTPTGGLTGEIVFEGHLQPFLPFLVWGQLTHVGKDATKGNGWYRIAES